ncbi:penicillin-binding protein [Fervidobacterium thailandense]|uniref:Penicillin-binding protein n=1 Tax=Fervidobacterium thailandense TaxID=1008305 RepID=A0A1E3G0Y5_9BACT|nr:penicillin-binding protein [Fervidobacterium thailandense]
MDGRRVFLVIFVLILLVGMFTFKIWHNIRDHKYAITTKQIALRGNIYDSKGRLIATSEVVYAAYLDVEFLKSVSGNAYKKDPDFLRLIGNFNVVEKLEDLDSVRFLKLGTFSNREEIIKKIPVQYMRFVSIEPEEKRISLSSAGMNFIIGKAESRTGITGVEAYFDKLLRPIRDGIASVSYSGFIGGRFQKIEVPPQNGKNVQITIDSLLQKKLFDVALNYQKEKEASEVGVIVMETKTGKVRVAFSTQSWPTFYMGYFEPGSTVKPLVFAAALELGEVAPDTRFYCPGYVKPDPNLRISIRDIEVHKDITLYDGLVHSCNTVAVETARKLVEKYGQEKLYEILSAVGFGSPTGIELPGEVAGVLRPVDNWYKLDWAYVSIGQSVGTTPIQLLAALNTLFNGGIYVTPTLDESKKPVGKRVFSEKTVGIVQSMLVDVVERGTGVKARVEGLKILGKTGTAQKPGKKDVTAIFVGSTVISNVQYSIIVWVDSPQKEKLSSLVAAPLFADVVRTICEYQTPNAETTLLQRSNYKGRDIEDLKGCSLPQVLEFAKRNGLTIELHGDGLYVKDFSFQGDSLKVWLTWLPPKLTKISEPTD